MDTSSKAKKQKTSATKQCHRTLATETEYIPNYPKKLFKNEYYYAAIAQT